MKENENIERGKNSLEGKHRQQKSQQQTGIEVALQTDVEQNATHLANLEASTAAIAQDDKAAAATQVVVDSIQQSLHDLDALQTSLRQDRTRSDAEKLYAFSEKSAAGFETIENHFKTITQQNTARLKAAESQLFSATASSLNAIETSMIQVMGSALNRPDAGLLTGTASETRVTLYLLDHFPGLITNRLVDPMDDGNAIRDAANERFTPDAYAASKNCRDIQEVTDNWGRSIGRNRSALLPETIITELKNGRI